MKKLINILKWTPFVGFGIYALYHDCKDEGFLVTTGYLSKWTTANWIYILIIILSSCSEQDIPYPENRIRPDTTEYFHEPNRTGRLDTTERPYRGEGIKPNRR